MNIGTKSVFQEHGEESFETENNFVWAELIEDPVTIAECRVKIRSEGRLLVCHRCADVRSSVVAFLAMSEAREECYALCDNCLRDLPQEIDP